MSFMKNENGNVSISVIVAILLLSMLYMGTSFMKAESSLDSVSQISESTETFVHDFNSKERLFSLLSENKSFVGTANYEDLDRSFNVETTDETFQEIELPVLSSEGGVDFKIENATEITIEIEGDGYSVKLMHNGEDVLNGQGANLNGDKVITVKEEQVYNQDNNETNYGDYKLHLDGNASANIKYNDLIERTVLVKGSGFNRSIVINQLGIEYGD